MTWQAQTNYIAAALEQDGLRCEREKNAGDGLWCGIRADIVAHGLPRYQTLGIEVKWQSVGGSTAYKIPHAVLTIKRHYPWPGVIICSGPSKELMAALDWAKGEVDGNLIGAFTTEEFFTWLKKEKTIN